MSRFTIAIVAFAWAGCDGTPPPLGPDALGGLQRGPVRAVRDDRTCIYHYDDADHLIARELRLPDNSLIQAETYTWDGDELAEIDFDGVAWLVNDATGATVTPVSAIPFEEATYDAPYSLPLVLECDAFPASSLDDHVLSVDWGDGQRDDYTYSGVMGGQEGMRRWTATRTPPFAFEIPSDYAVSAAFTYDAEGRRVRSAWVIEDEPGEFVDTDFRPDGRPSHRVSGYDDQVYERTFAYDDAGNLLSIDELNDGEPRTEIYEY